MTWNGICKICTTSICCESRSIKATIWFYTTSTLFILYLASPLSAALSLLSLVLLCVDYASKLSIPLLPSLPLSLPLSPRTTVTMPRFMANCVHFLLLLCLSHKRHITTPPRPTIHPSPLLSFQHQREREFLQELLTFCNVWLLREQREETQAIEERTIWGRKVKK